MKSLLWMLLGPVLAVLVACGGGGGGEPNVPPSAPLIGASGGTVSEAGGAQVSVPAGAFSAPTTLRIAQDSTGAPALPAELTAAGSTYVVTPHGGSFVRPAEVRIPMPSIALAPNQAFMLAKADPGGDWMVLGNTQVRDGMLVAQVNSFSYFVAVVIDYALPLAQAAPFALTSAELDCQGQPCLDLVGPVTATFSYTGNGGQPPLSCPGAQLKLFFVRESSIGGLDIDVANDKEIANTVRGSLTRAVPDTPDASPVYYFGLLWECTGTTALGTRRFKMLAAQLATFRAAQPVYPALTVTRMPGALDAVAGQSLEIEAILAGGAYRSADGSTAALTPTDTDRAIVTWQRSDDGGASWREVAQSFQNEANPQPLGATQRWVHWSVRHGFTVSPADQGALFRVFACYTPGSGAAPPCVTSAAVRLNVLQQSALPVITTAPRSMLIRTGQTASLGATAAGAPAPTLQWQTRAANATGAWVDVSTGTGGDTGNFTTAVLALADNGTQFRVVARNGVGTAESAAVTVSVSDLDVAPSVTSQPASLSVATGSDAALAVTARGTEALSYQWQFNGVAIAGANAPLLRLAAVDSSRAGSYTVTVSNAAGTTTSNPALLTVTPGAAVPVAPSIVNPPVPVQVNAGNTATFAVGVAGTAPFSYQWLKNGQAIAGATAAFYSLPSAAAGDAAAYAVRVTNSVSGVTSASATLTVSATAQPSAVAISTQPAPQVQPAGGSATFAVAASGSGPLGYQWLKDGQPLAGQTAAVLNLAALNGSDAGSYSVTVSNAQGPLTSDAAVLTVLGTPAITGQPQATTQVAGGTATFSVTATGQSLRYLWLRNGVPVTGGSAAVLTTPALSTGDSGAVYSVLVFNAAGVAVSNTAVLTVTPAVVTTSLSVLAGSIGSRAYLDGTGSSARFNSPVALALDNAGNAYVREPCLIREVTPAGVVSTLAGVAGDCNIADGPPGTARVGGGTGIAVDGFGNVFFSDGAGAIRKSTPAGVLSTVAGDAVATGFADGTGASARFDRPHGLAIDVAGNLYVADTNNAAIRVVTPGGAVSTLARGQAGGGFAVVDGPVGSATFSMVVALALDAAGTLYVADEGTNSIRKIAGGQVSTLAGSVENNSGSSGAVDGTGTTARFNSPEQLAVDADGNVYVADLLNAAVRKITPAGSVSTVLGVLGDNRMLPNATPPRISTPAGLALAATGQLWLTSLDAHVVLRATVP